MIKTIAFLKRRAGMTRAQFVHHYETVHAPLILSIAPQVCEYRRNFIVEEGAINVAGLPALDFDVVTELWYPDRAAYDAALARFTEPGNAARIAADEELLFDRSRTRFHLVEEYCSSRR